jgi:LytS/YehU family sensor histidine kinase
MMGLYAWRELGVLLGSFDPLKKPTSLERKISAVILFTPGAFVLFAVFKLFFDYVRLKFEGQQVHLEKNQAELAFLKSQINPHFLFNTLNNIYSLSQHQPQLVSESVLRLSKLLRYILYEASTDFIAVDKELKVLSDYIDLEKLRYNETVSIEFHHEKDNFSYIIPPLLLLPLVENAFKHGVSQTRGERFVNVRLILKEQNLFFEVNNSAQAIGVQVEPKENIGLSNLRRRLELLYKEFHLTTKHDESIYTTVLTINLATHVKN